MVIDMRLIDADALMEELKTPVLIDNEKASRIWEGWHECTIAVKEAIDRTPTIEERKKGKWIEITDHETPIVCKCTECGWLTTHYDSFLFCPNCGSYNGGDKNVNE